ncbi:hypothetical protein I7X12_10500 [Halosimplex litoreum]|uniref:IclR helix-turn-helix domain-containing protein n=1 Tax=Halosimplex litoreum TaxID=1198301 RepID=A0A7T3FV06_9EURY|nr:hypothetical protein [Halosimplex litoreum]QPV61203.1 hypothetical protein I7X12_10500 [Halosimplex litoreum]
MSPRSFAVVVTALLLLLPVGVAPVAALGAAGATGPAANSGMVGANVAPHNGSIDQGEIEMRVEVAADGDARWRVKTVVSDSITTADERAAFDDFVEEFNGTESPLALDSFVEAADDASRVTGREMTVRDVERHHALHDDTGAVWVTFTWTNFGRTSGDLLSVDDAFNTSSGVWLSSLAESETLVVVPPSGYGISSAPTSGSVAASSLAGGVARWEGPQSFGQRGPWIVYSGDAETATPTTRPPTVTPTESPGGPTTGTGTGPGDDIAGALPFVVVVVLGGASAAVLVAYMRREDDGLGGLVGSGDGPGAGAAADDGSLADDEAAGAATDGAPPADDATATAGPEAAGSAGASGSTADAESDAETTGETDGADDDIDEELLSDEERVERLIEDNGGRMKQAAIVQETGWSNAKVSQLLSAMDDDDRIDKLRIGRENLISFPDEDVTDLDSE